MGEGESDKVIVCVHQITPPVIMNHITWTEGHEHVFTNCAQQPLKLQSTFPNSLFVFLFYYGILLTHHNELQ